MNGVRPLIIDTNLLVLLVVGLTCRTLIAKHKRLKEFSEADFDTLTKILRRYGPIVVTPNIWTETSNIARQIEDPAKTHIAAVMGRLMQRSEEAYVASADAGARAEFPRLGLTDTVLLEVQPPSAPILTTDLDLYLAAQNAGRSCFNFNHIREANRE